MLARICYGAAVTTLPADDETPVRQRLSAEDRRSAMIAAARVLFARNGFRGTGTSDIAAAAGCSEPIIYKRFASQARALRGRAGGLGRG